MVEDATEALRAQIRELQAELEAQRGLSALLQLNEERLAEAQRVGRMGSYDTTYGAT